MTPRNLALAVLNRADERPGQSDRYLEEAFRGAEHLTERDRAFSLHIVRGVYRWRLRLDWILRSALRIPFEDIEPAVLNILRIALYQIFFMDRVPESAAVDEAVRQTRRAGRKHVSGFVNGVLRNICRRKAEIPYPDPQTDRPAFLSVFHSYPLWLVEKWERELGHGSGEELLAAGNRIPSLVVRANTLKGTRAGLVRRLGEEGVEAKAGRYTPESVQILRLGGSVAKLAAFREGLFQVQSEAAQICSHLLAPTPGDRVLDICAGVGGKTTHLAQIAKDRGAVLGLDISHGRLLDLRQSAYRLGLGSVRSVVADAERELPFLLSKPFDRIMVDAPCSALGVIARHPDAKWTRREEDVRRLARTQCRILEKAAPLLRAGGHLLYVTCTVSMEENEGVVGAFLSRAKGMAQEDLRGRVPGWASPLIDERGFFQSLPHVHGIEGFFGALFTKKRG